MIHIRSCASCKSAIAASRLETHGHRQKSPISFACTFCSFTNSLDFYCSHELFMLCSDWRLQTFMTHASIKTTLSRHDDWFDKPQDQRVSPSQLLIKIIKNKKSSIGWPLSIRSMGNLPWVSDNGPVYDAQQLQIIVPGSLTKKPSYC